eukprot:COSAG06_NODE_70515_length_191_cov_112.760870_1_plen_26_part_01
MTLTELWAVMGVWRVTSAGTLPSGTT